MPQAIRTATRIQDQDDFTGGLAADQFIQCDGSNFLLAAIVTGVADTRANILARSSDPTPTFALATDTRELLVWDGTNWNALPLEVNVELQAPDMGAHSPDGLGASDRAGYYDDAITDKTLHNVRLLYSVLEEEGSIRTTPDGVLQVYLNGVWNDVVINFRLREDPDGNYEFEHMPIGFTEWIEILSGNSDTLGLNGLPIIQQYRGSMGAYPVPLQIDGGEF
jgi:hypothetical protein